MQPFLIDEAARAAFRIFGVMRIGRAPENTVMVTDPTVSRLHAEVWVEGGKAFIRSLGSNGTRINGTRVPGTWELEEGDQVDIGWTSLRYTAQPLPFGIHGAKRGIAGAAQRSAATSSQVASSDGMRETVLEGRTVPRLDPILEDRGPRSRTRVLLIGGVLLTFAAAAVFALR